MHSSSQQYVQQEQEHPFVTSSSLLQQLKTIYQLTLEQEKKELNQLLNLEKLLNLVHSTIPSREDESTKKPLQKQPKPQQQKREFNIQRIGQKLQQLIEDTQQLTIIQNLTDTKKPSLIPMTSKPKKQAKKPQTITQDKKDKKPLIPTQNRSHDPNSRMINPTKYIPPRNRNQVTGKVTQTKIMTQEKVFRPEIVAGGKGNVGGGGGSSGVITGNKHLSYSVEKKASMMPTTINASYNNNNTTANNQAHKIQTQSTTSVPSSPIIPSQLLPSADIDANSISQYKNLRANTKASRLRQFSKPLEQISSEITKKKASAKKKLNFKQLLEKYQTEEMGHRGLEEKRRLQFMKKFSNFSLSVNRSSCNQITASIKKRVWKEYPYIFQFNNLLQTLQEDMSKIQQDISNDLRIDLKQAYRLQYKTKLLQTQLQQIRQSTEIEVPQKLNLSFKPLTLPSAKSFSSQNHHDPSASNTLALQMFYSNLNALLSQMQQNQSLGTKQLSLLRVITQIGVHSGRRSPLIVKADDFQDWKESYAEVDDR